MVLKDFHYIDDVVCSLKILSKSLKIIYHLSIAFLCQKLFCPLLLVRPILTPPDGNLIGLISIGWCWTTVSFTSVVAWVLSTCSVFCAVYIKYSDWIVVRFLLDAIFVDGVGNAASVDTLLDIAFIDDTADFFFSSSI